MSMQGSVEISTDPAENILTMHFAGDVHPAETRTIGQVLSRSLRQLRRGFTLLTDLTGLESMDVDCVPDITRTMDACLAAGVGRVVRIIPDPYKDIGFNLLSLTHYRGKVPTATYESLEAARREFTSPP
jgi:hypothetical protein